MRDLRIAPGETLLALDEIVSPTGPAPYRKTKFLELVAAGKAPAPALRAPRCTRWRWSDIQSWLSDLAAEGGA